MVNPEIKQPSECPTCRTMGRKRCPIHGEGAGSGGGSAGGSSDASGKEERPKALESGVFFSKNPPFTISPLTSKVGSPILAPENALNAEATVILKLLEGKLTIDNDGEPNTLSIKLDSSSLSAEQKIEVNNFLNSIVDELHAIETDKNGNILSFSIKMPIKETHETFMKQLLSNNGALHFTNQGKADSADNKRSTLSTLSTPLSMKPAPRGSK